MISNFYPIVFPMNSFQIERIPFDQKKLRSLRKNHNANNSFFARDGAIYISPMAGDRIPGGELISLDIIQNREVVGSLVRHVFFRTFRKAYPNLVPLDFYPFRILSRKGEHDLLATALKSLRFDGTEIASRLSNKKLIEIQFRDIIHNKQPTLGAVINVRYCWSYGDMLSCATLHSDGFNLINRDVLLVEPLPGLEGVLAPDETLVGRLISLSGETANIETNRGSVTKPLSQLVPQKNYRNINDILSHFLGAQRTERIRQAVKERDSSRLNAKTYYEEISDMAKAFSKLEYRNQDNFTFDFSCSPLRPDKKFRIEDPIFRFDYNPGASNKNPSFGLLKHGPYDSMSFSPKTPRIAILCHRSSRDAFTSFLGRLRDGIPESTNFPGGMLGKYRLENILFDAARDIIEIQNYTADEYERAVAEYLKSNDSDKRANLVLIQTKDDFKTYNPRQNPYYRAKARFLMAEIPTQFLKVETIRKPDAALRYTIDSVGLQIYAKMGGIPYVLPAGNNVEREIVVGIGNAVTRSNTYSGNEQERVVGITTFFKADGEYIFGRRCREVPYSDYFETLLSDLRDSLDEIASGYGWRNGDAVRFVFHVFKPMKNIEAEVVAKLVEDYPQYRITFAFVTVTDQHPFVLFNEKNDKGKEVRGRKVGEFVPLKKENWVLDEYSCLVQLSGLEEMSTVYHAFSTPVIVRIHRNSTYYDLHAITQQVFNFVFLSWRTFKPSRIPVTINYANRISSILTNLNKLDGWRSEIINAKEIQKKKWFL